MQTFIFFTRRLSRNFTRHEDRPYPVRRQPLLAALLLAACSPALEKGTFEPAPFEGDDVRIGRTASPLTASVGEVLIVEGDGLVSGIGDFFGIRFDEDVNDLARLTARIAEEGADVDGLVVLFTTFQDRGAAGPAYHVPFYEDVAGTGDDDVDQRDAFGVERLTGIANLKRLDAHDDPVAIFLHEVGHRHLAHLVADVGGSTTTAPLLGRQQAHWHALLETNGSVLGGHAFVESQPGRFVVRERDVRYSDLDLYALGLIGAEEVEPFFFVADATNEAGFAIPAEAQLQPNTAVLGRRVDVTIDDVVRAVGPRDPPYGTAETELRVRFVLLTAPGEAATSSTALATAQTIETFRTSIGASYGSYVRDRGTICTSVAECTSAPKPPDDDGCSCSVNRKRRGRTAVAWFVLLFVGVRTLSRRTPTSNRKRAS